MNVSDTAFMPFPHGPFTPLPSSWRDAALGEYPSVLFETTLFDKENHQSFLFTKPRQVLQANLEDELPALFSEIEAALASGMYVAGYFPYECGYHFQQLPFHGTGEPLALLGVFDAPTIFDHLQPSSALDKRDLAGPPLPLVAMLQISPETYAQKLGRIQQWIAAGDTYQVNYTTNASSHFEGSATELYDRLTEQQPCRYGAVLRLDPRQTILSLSPELFFRVDSDRRITTRPMKGTAERGISASEDDRHVEVLRTDEKTRAEHVMIVDLLRNDLGRICTMGSVHTPDLFTIERYPTLLQMTSTVTGTLRDNVRWYDIFQALFPCGSVTGAPKHHTMELIRRLETRPRGIYTGAIGYFAPDGTAAFNVAIRTLTLKDKIVCMGVGSGIVADSQPSEEFRECLLKTRFLERASEPLLLFETLRWDGRFALLPLHLTRMRHSAEALGFAIDENAIHARLSVLTEPWDRTPQRVRFSLARSGEIVITHTPLQPWPSALHARLSPVAMQSHDPALQHKTTFRASYDREYSAATTNGFHEAIFLNEQGRVTEGCISNIIATIDGVDYTPLCPDGALPGVFRQALLQNGKLQERSVTLQDVLQAEAVYLCNAVRGAAPLSSLRVGNVLHHFPPASAERFSLW